MKKVKKRPEWKRLGGGVNEYMIFRKNHCSQRGVETGGGIDSQYWRNIILRICIRRRRWQKTEQEQEQIKYQDKHQQEQEQEQIKYQDKHQQEQEQQHQQQKQEQQHQQQHQQTKHQHQHQQ